MDRRSIFNSLVLFIVGATASGNETNTSEIEFASTDGFFVDLPNEFYTALRGENFSVNHSFIDFTTMATIKRRQKSGFRLPRVPPSNAFLDILDEMVMPVALCLGIIGNIVLFPIFVYSPLKGNSLSHYLAAMGVSDFLYLVSCLIVWTTGRGLTIYHTIGVCQLTSFFLRLSRCLSTWYLFAAHVERLLVHFGSFRAKACCSTFRTKFIIIFVFVFSLVGFLHYIWTHVVSKKYGQNRCMIMIESIRHIIRLGKIEMIAALFLPMLLIVTIDIALFINTIVKRYKTYFRVPSKNGSVKSEPCQDDLGDYVLASRQRNGSHSNRVGDSEPPPPQFDLSLQKWPATMSVVICGLIFIGLFLPSSVYTAKIYFLPKSRLTQEDMLTMRLFEQLVNFNSVYKFILYLVLLRPFRKGLVYIFKCCHGRKPEENSSQETTGV